MFNLLLPAPLVERLCGLLKHYCRRVTWGLSERSGNCLLRGRFKASHDDADIIFPAAFVGLGHETFASRPGLVVGFKGGVDTVVVHHLRQAIGTQQERVVRVQLNPVTLHSYPPLTDPMALVMTWRKR